MTRLTKILTVLVIAGIVVAASEWNRIAGGVAVTVVVIVVMTIWAWRKYGADPATRRLVIPLYGGLFSLVAVCTGVVLYTTARSDYSACLDRVDRSEKAYRSSLLLFNSIDAATHSTHFTSDALIPGQPSLRAALQLPVTVADCQKYHP